ARVVLHVESSPSSAIVLRTRTLTSSFENHQRSFAAGHDAVQRARRHDVHAAGIDRDCFSIDEQIDFSFGHEQAFRIFVTLVRMLFVVQLHDFHVHRDHTCASPPSTARSAPVMNDASFDARNAAALATSSAEPKRPSGMCEMVSLRNASNASGGRPSLPKIGVSIGPGLIAFTRTLRPASSRAAVRTSERSAAFVAEYAVVPSIPLLFAIDELMITAAPSDKIGSAYLSASQSPRTFKFHIASKSASFASASGANRAMPALRKRMSRRPCLRATVSKSFATLRSSAASASTTLIDPGSCWRAAWSVAGFRPGSVPC